MDRKKGTKGENQRFASLGRTPPAPARCEPLCLGLSLTRTFTALKTCHTEGATRLVNGFFGEITGMKSKTPISRAAP